jgi:hypothetical protein
MTGSLQSNYFMLQSFRGRDTRNSYKYPDAKHQPTREAPCSFDPNPFWSSPHLGGSVGDMLWFVSIFRTADCARFPHRFSRPNNPAFARFLCNADGCKLSYRFGSFGETWDPLSRGWVLKYVSPFSVSYSAWLIWHTDTHTLSLPTLSLSLFQGSLIAMLHNVLLIQPAAEFWFLEHSWAFQVQDV